MSTHEMVIPVFKIPESLCASLYEAFILVISLAIDRLPLENLYACHEEP